MAQPDGLNTENSFAQVKARFNHKRVDLTYKPSPNKQIPNSST